MFFCGTINFICAVKFWRYIYFFSGEFIYGVFKQGKILARDSFFALNKFAVKLWFPEIFPVNYYFIDVQFGANFALFFCEILTEIMIYFCCEIFAVDLLFLWCFYYFLLFKPWILEVDILFFRRETNSL